MLSFLNGENDPCLEWAIEIMLCSCQGVVFFVPSDAMGSIRLHLEDGSDPFCVRSSPFSLSEKGVHDLLDRGGDHFI